MSWTEVQGWAGLGGTRIGTSRLVVIDKAVHEVSFVKNAIWEQTTRYCLNQLSAVADPGFLRQGRGRQPTIWPIFLKNSIKMKKKLGRGHPLCAAWANYLATHIEIKVFNISEMWSKNYEWQPLKAVPWKNILYTVAVILEIILFGLDYSKALGNLIFCRDLPTKYGLGKVAAALKKFNIHGLLFIGGFEVSDIHGILIWGFPLYPFEKKNEKTLWIENNCPKLCSKFVRSNAQTLNWLLTNVVHFLYCFVVI